MPRVARAATIERRRGELAARKSAVLDAAETEFRENGYHAATMAGIAERAGVSVGTVYNFFGNKASVFAAAMRRIGRELVESVAGMAGPRADAEAAVDALIRLRVRHQGRQGAFLALFERAAPGGRASPGQAADELAALHGRYLALVARIFRRAARAGRFGALDHAGLARRFDAVLNAFVGYWRRPDPSGPLEALCGEIKEALRRIGGLGGAAGVSPDAPAEPPQPGREIYITRFDRARLAELIAVAGEFGGPELAPHLRALDAELARARVVSPRKVPADVVTMNSRVRVLDLSTGVPASCRLVFPADAGGADENVSVLEPLGTALLGCRVGALAQAPSGDAFARYRVEEILYQPESAGHYHL